MNTKNKRMLLVHDFVIICPTLRRVRHVPVAQVALIVRASIVEILSYFSMNIKLERRPLACQPWQRVIWFIEHLPGEQVLSQSALHRRNE
jgi:hypothetical protein